MQLNSPLDEILFGCLLESAFECTHIKFMKKEVRVSGLGCAAGAQHKNGGKHKAYLYWLYDIFTLYVSSGVNCYTKKNFEQYSFQTLMFPFFKIYKDMFYNSTTKCKIVSLSVEKELTPIALAFWFMDDGSNSKRSLGFILCCHNFTQCDVNLLSSTINLKFNLNSEVRKDRKYFVIYIPGESRQIFIDLIKPFMMPEMLYKFDNCSTNVDK